MMISNEHLKNAGGVHTIGYVDDGRNRVISDVLQFLTLNLVHHFPTKGVHKVRIGDTHVSPWSHGRLPVSCACYVWPHIRTYVPSVRPWSSLASRHWRSLSTHQKSVRSSHIVYDKWLCADLLYPSLVKVPLFSVLRSWEYMPDDIRRISSGLYSSFDMPETRGRRPGCVKVEC
jgi:hypothetical protein